MARHKTEVLVSSSGTCLGSCYREAIDIHHWYMRHKNTGCLAESITLALALHDLLLTVRQKVRATLLCLWRDDHILSLSVLKYPGSLLSLLATAQPCKLGVCIGAGSGKDCGCSTVLPTLEPCRGCC